MANEGRKVPLGDIAEIYDGPHATPPKTDTGPIFLGISCLSRGRLNLADAEHLSEDDFARWTRRVTPQPGDVVFSYETRIGEAAQIPQGLRCCLGRRMGLLRPKPERVDSRYLLYAYLGDEFQETLRSRTVPGSTVDRILLEELPRFPIRIPISIYEQRAIAHILGTLDDKIDLNRRMSETLEAMTRALFHSWFVDFDPVRSDVDRSEPSLAKCTEGLFPLRLEDSELGEIPSGWAVGSILDQARLLSGGTPKTERQDYWNGNIPWASAKDVSQCDELFLVNTERNITERGLQESATQLVPRLSTVVVARGATTGRMAILGREMTMNQTCYALDSLTGTPLALYCQLRHKIEDLVHAAHGSVFDTITTNTFKTGRFILPPVAVLRGFEKIVSPLFERILANCQESRTLAELRDTLLPRLISGELRVNGGEELVAKASA